MLLALGREASLNALQALNALDESFYAESEIHLLTSDTLDVTLVEHDIVMSIGGVATHAILMSMSGLVKLQGWPL